MFATALLTSVLAGSADCDAVRRSLELARSEQLDTRALSQLEVRHCSATTQNDVCIEASTLWLMSMVAQAGRETAALEATRAVVCSQATGEEQLLSWPDRSTLKTRSGNWSWDDGAIAKSPGARGTWYWPSGTIARSGNGTLFYPNGSLARSGAGGWFLPDGSSVTNESTLGAAACKSNLEVCRAWLAYVSVTTGAARDMALLGLGWSLRR